MITFKTYLLVVSSVVVIALAIFLSALIWYIYTLTIRLISIGYWDQDLIQEYEHKRKKPPKRLIGKVVSAVICGVLSVMLLFSIFLGISEKAPIVSSPSLMVVKSESMSAKHKDNEHLFDQDLNNQIQMFDIIVTHAPPAEEDIELYDIIVYEVNGDLIIHRVVYIVEPTKEGDDRLFYTRGDANKRNDDMPVRYNQIKGIYKDERIPFVGSFVLFMQSPAGIICLLLSIFAMIIMPIVDDKIANARRSRHEEIRTGYTYRFYRKH